MATRILVVDDEPDLLELVAYNLRQAGYQVATARDGMSALAEARRTKPDLVVLDVMLPDLSGTEVCKRLRRDPATENVPVLMLTARAQESDVEQGFDAGADDYVVKPFSPRELVLRVNAVLRRSKAPSATPTPRLVCGSLEMDVDAHRVTVGGEEIPLTALEFRLLQHLAAARGRVQTRDSLLEEVWGYVPGVETRTVDTHVKRLREKLGAASDYIETVRGVGYRMRDDVE